MAITLDVKTRQFTIYSSGRVQISRTIEEYPHECPLCHVSTVMNPSNVLWNFIEKNNEFCKSDYLKTGLLQLIFRCPNCYRLFVATYIEKNPVYSLNSVEPSNPKFVEFHELIQEISPFFTEIYRESSRAMSLNLYQIAGCGFRKSLEYLIKDYCIHKNKAKKKEIKKAFLGDAIKKYVKNENIIKCAERAVWLGNDETHYVRKWNGMEIKDLISLINLTQHWITSDLETERYLKKMPDKNKE